MIAPGLTSVPVTRSKTRSGKTEKQPRFHSYFMSNFLFDLVMNLALLTMLLIACHACNCVRPGLALNGGYVFVLLGVAATAFDAALTFLVFADARSHYGKFSSPTEFVHRASAYAIAGVIAMFIGRHLHLRTDRTKDQAADSVVIQTSAYTESHLPM